MIQLEKLCKTFLKDGHVEVAALQGLDLVVQKGEFVAIQGPSGSGKSSLLHVLGCLDKPSSGRYLLDGIDVAPLDDDALSELRNRKIGVVFQSFNLLPRTTALENVELPLLYSEQEVSAGQAAAALAAVGLGHRQRHYASEMSGGEQQRVAIARALINDPALILADEPTGNLDSRAGLEIMALLQELNRRGRTIVMVTHDPLVAAHARRVVRIRDGRVESDAPVPAPRDARQQLSEG
jgi:putative ABC transport system ATP-binding protein